MMYFFYYFPLSMDVRPQRFAWGTLALLLAMCMEAGAAPVEEDQNKGRESMFSLIRKGGPVMVPTNGPSGLLSTA